MTRERRKLGVKGALRVEGPGSPFHVRGEGGRLDVRVPDLRTAWHVRGTPGVERAAHVAARFGLPFRVLVRGHEIAAGGGGGRGGVEVRWLGIARAALAALGPGGGR